MYIHISHWLEHWNPCRISSCPSVQGRCALGVRKNSESSLTYSSMCKGSAKTATIWTPVPNIMFLDKFNWGSYLSRSFALKVPESSFHKDCFWQINLPPVTSVGSCQEREWLRKEAGPFTHRTLTENNQH